MHILSFYLYFCTNLIIFLYICLICAILKKQKEVMLYGNAAHTDPKV